MGELREVIKTQAKANKRATVINHVLWFVVAGLVGGCIYLTNYAADKKEEAIVKAELLKQTNENLLTTTEELQITQENLEGEKAKLEEMMVAYDSLRKEVLAQQNRDELWDYAVQQNTVEAYTDYIEIKGISEKVVEKLDATLTRTGFVMMRDENGEWLFKQLSMEDPDNEEFKNLNVWVPQSARSVRKGVIGKAKQAERTGDVVLKGQVVKVVHGNIHSGKTIWAKIKY